MDDIWFLVIQSIWNDLQLNFCKRLYYYMIVNRTELADVFGVAKTTVDS